MKSPCIAGLARLTRLTLALPSAALWAAGCSNSAEPSNAYGSGGAAASSNGQAGGFVFTPGGGGASDDDAGPPGPTIDDFPSDPVFVDGAGPSLVSAFQSAGGADSGPCIVSPEPGTLYPKNWLRPRFAVQAKASHNAFQVTVSTARFAHSLVIYATKPSITLDAALWAGLRNSVIDEPVQVSIRSAALDAKGKLTNGPTAPSTTSFSIAPVAAPGKIVYWSLPRNDTQTGLIRGFGIGEEGVVDVLEPAQVAARDHEAKCIGCHTATPDGNAVAFGVGPGGYTVSIAGITPPDVGAVPSLVAPPALDALSALRGVPAFSKAHWATGDRVTLLSDTGSIHWINLSDNRSGELARTGDERAATVPSWSHDGEHVVYTSAAGVTDGRPEHGPMDLRVIPYADGAGGPSEKLAGAADDAYNEYYPAYSPDDAFVAFTRVPDAQATYNARMAEVFVVPAAGGEATRLAANDAPACTKQVSPGLTNSWPKWSPRAQAANGKTYYFLTFSSRRPETPQLYVTALVDDGHSLTTYPALYLWNQPADEGNHTPDWEAVNIPSVPVPK